MIPAPPKPPPRVLPGVRDAPLPAEDPKDADRCPLCKLPWYLHPRMDGIGEPCCRTFLILKKVEP